MTLEYTLKQNGIDPKKDLTIDTSIAFAAMSGAFIGGTGDFVTLFEPNVKLRKHLYNKKYSNKSHKVLTYLNILIINYFFPIFYNSFIFF